MQNKPYDALEALKELNKLNEDEEKIAEIKTKYPDAYVPEIDEKTGLPILPDELFGDWEY